jgi:hypothetical protein
MEVGQDAWRPRVACHMTHVKRVPPVTLCKWAPLRAPALQQGSQLAPLDCNA